jgi:hypothetical protein
VERDGIGVDGSPPEPPEGERPGKERGIERGGSSVTGGSSFICGHKKTLLLIKLG